MSVAVECSSTDQNFSNVHSCLPMVDVLMQHKGLLSEKWLCGYWLGGNPNKLVDIVTGEPFGLGVGLYLL